MATRKIQTGDSIKVIAGKYKGQLGTVTSTYTKKKYNKNIITRVTISGLDLQVAYQKGYKAAGVPGQQYTKERSVDISNVSLMTPQGVISKTSIQKTKEGTQRLLKKSGDVVTKVTKKPEEKEKKLKKK